MNTNTRGEYRNITLLIGDQTLEVAGDGRTVWVNGPAGLIARFCPVSSELTKDSKYLSFIHKNSEPTLEDWHAFRKLVFEHTLIPVEVTEDYRPTYL